MEGGISEGETLELSITAKNMHGEGISTVNNTVVFVRNAKTRIGKTYSVKITKVHRTFAYAELVGEDARADTDSKYFIHNGSLIIT